MSTITMPTLLTSCLQARREDAKDLEHSCHQILHIYYYYCKKVISIVYIYYVAAWHFINYI